MCLTFRLFCSWRRCYLAGRPTVRAQNWCTETVLEWQEWKVIGATSLQLKIKRLFENKMVVYSRRKDRNQPPDQNNSSQRNRFNSLQMIVCSMFKIVLFPFEHLMWIKQQSVWSRFMINEDIKGHRIKDEPANLKSLKIIMRPSGGVSKFSKQQCQRWKSITKNVWLSRRRECTRRWF